MSTIKGNAGVVKVATNAVAEITGFTVTETVGVVEDTVIGDTARTYVSDGLPTWTAAVNCRHYAGDTTGQAALLIGASVSLEFYPAGTGTGAEKLSGTGIVTNRQLGEVANGQIVPLALQIQGSGALTHGTVSE